MLLKKMNVLLADDDSDDCAFFKEALEELPLSTNFTMVHDGDKLMQVLNNETNHLPDVLFLDINMPRKNGFECLLEIRQNKHLKNLPVVMYSTTSSRDTISSLFKSGAFVYIHKPRDFSEIKRVIQHAINMATEKLVSANNLKYILNA
jgi:CheY-like chemotaxis protein